MRRRQIYSSTEDMEAYGKFTEELQRLKERRKTESVCLCETLSNVTFIRKKEGTDNRSECEKE